MPQTACVTLLWGLEKMLDRQRPRLTLTRSIGIHDLIVLIPYILPLGTAHEKVLKTKKEPSHEPDIHIVRGTVVMAAWGPGRRRHLDRYRTLRATPRTDRGSHPLVWRRRRPRAAPREVGRHASLPDAVGQLPPTDPTRLCAVQPRRSSGECLMRAEVSAAPPPPPSSSACPLTDSPVSVCSQGGDGQSGAEPRSHSSPPRAARP